VSKSLRSKTMILSLVSLTDAVFYEIPTAKVDEPSQPAAELTRVQFRFPGTSD
jgi:hypothetical protein